MLIIDSD